MRKDVKTGMLAGTGLVMLAAVAFSLLSDSVTVQRQKRLIRQMQNRTGGAEPAIVHPNQNTRPSKDPAAELSVNDIDRKTARIHIVRAGQTLSSISVQYYGAPDRWKLILEANAGTIGNADQIREGMRVLIPTCPATGNPPQH